MEGRRATDEERAQSVAEDLTKPRVHHYRWSVRRCFPAAEFSWLCRNYAARWRRDQYQQRVALLEASDDEQLPGKLPFERLVLAALDEMVEYRPELHAEEVKFLGVKAQEWFDRIDRIDRQEPGMTFEDVTHFASDALCFIGERMKEIARGRPESRLGGGSAR